MRLPELLLIAVALAMDAFAVSIASGAAIRNFHVRHAFVVAAWLGGFQALMPFLGWECGVSLRSFIAEVDHWVAFVLLVFLGVKMIYESFEIETVENPRNPLRVGALLTLSIATSVDALIVGVVLAVQSLPIGLPIAVIGAVTFAICFSGVCLGAAGAHFFERKVEIVGGLALIGIGVKTLFSHLLA